MKVLKFGGTSVGTVESLLNVKSIVEGIDAPAVVVVSALGGLTDKLIATANMAAEGDPAYRDEMEAISSRHFHIISNVVPEDKRPEVIKEVSLLLNELKRIYDGLSLIKDLPAKTLDVIVSFGERMSSVIVAAMIDGAERRDSLNFIKTEKWFDKNIADQKLTTQLVIEEFQTPFNKAIVPGFIATDKDSGEITTLGRGGSDFTGALIAAALEAEQEGEHHGGSGRRGGGGSHGGHVGGLLQLGGERLAQRDGVTLLLLYPDLGLNLTDQVGVQISVGFLQEAAGLGGQQLLSLLHRFLESLLLVLLGELAAVLQRIHIGLAGVGDGCADGVGHVRQILLGDLALRLGGKVLDGGPDALDGGTSADGDGRDDDGLQQSGQEFVHDVFLLKFSCRSPATPSPGRTSACPRVWHPGRWPR